MRLAGTLVVFLAAAALASADDSKAPLAESKQTLQQLQNDQRSGQVDAADSSLKGAVPRLSAVAPGADSALADPVEEQKKRDKLRKKKQDEQKNWLLDAYDKLDPKADLAKDDDKATVPAPVATGEPAPRATTEPTLLALYEQQARADARNLQEGTVHHAPAADPMAPFLQNWLANSPVHDAAVAGLGPIPGAGNPDPLVPVVPAAPADGNGSVTTTGVGSLPTGLAQAKADNPYLLSLSLSPIPSAAPPGIATAPLVAPVDPLPPPVLNTGLPAGPSDPLLAPGKNEPHRPPMTQADEDKIYFPQLKRF